MQLTFLFPGHTIGGFFCGMISMVIWLPGQYNIEYGFVGQSGFAEERE